MLTFLFTPCFTTDIDKAVGAAVDQLYFRMSKQRPRSCGSRLSFFDFYLMTVMTKSEIEPSNRCLYSYKHNRICVAHSSPFDNTVC